MSQGSHTTDHHAQRLTTFKGYPIISDQISSDGLSMVWNMLEQVLTDNVNGAVVEFGCYIGTTSLFIRRLLDAYGQSSKRAFHVYDSFEGLPEKTSVDESSPGLAFQAGKLYGSKKQLLRQFQKASLQPPLIHKAWFSNLQAADIPKPIAFAFLDGDFYLSILDSLQLVWPRLQAGGKILIDDYEREALPGVTRAVWEFFQDKAIAIRRQANIAIIEK